MIQEPNNPQNFNRYTYVLNNPLSLTDPSGFSFLGKVGGFFKKYGRTIAAIGVTLIPGINVIAAGFIAGYISTGTLKGALIGAFTAGIGDKIAAIQGIGRFGEAFLQGALGGVGSVLSGGDFGHAFLAAGLSASVAGSKFSQGLSHTYSRSILNAIVGGTISEISGGKFVNGALTGAMQTIIHDVEVGVIDKVSTLGSGADDVNSEASIPDVIMIANDGFATPELAAEHLGRLESGFGVTNQQEFQTAIVQVGKGNFGYILPGFGAVGSAAVDPTKLFEAIKAKGFAIVAWAHGHFDQNLNFSGLDASFVHNAKGTLLLTNRNGETFKLTPSIVNGALSGVRGTMRSRLGTIKTIKGERVPKAKKGGG